MIISGGQIFGEDGQFFVGAVEITGDCITKVTRDVSDVCKRAEKEENRIDATGYYVIPGLVDIHLHGCAGHDFCEGTKQALDAMIEYETANGVTSIVPATMSVAKEELYRILETAGEYVKCHENSLCGVTLEGPFLSEEKRGAQNAKYLRKPDVSFYQTLQEVSGGLIRQVALAPEEDAEFAFLKKVSKETVVSVAHTKADYDMAKSAFLAGASHVTHLFNAMPPFHHRNPGVVGAALENPNVFVELICDGVHVHPAMVRTAFSLFGCERICMISDSMMATGMPDGSYSLGGQAVWVKGKQATLENGTIAGSVSNLMDCLRKSVLEMGIPLQEAVLSCSLTPARSLGIDESCGSIRVGKRADLLLLDQDLRLHMVIKGGSVREVS